MLTKPRATLEDVAVHAGVSASTVSLFVNGKLHRMSAPTQRRIAAAIEAVGYFTDPIALSLSTGKTRTIGLAWDAGSYDYYFEDIYFMYFAKKLTQELRANGYNLILIDPDELGSKSRLVDGVVIKATSSTWNDVGTLHQLNTEMPIVSLGKFHQANSIPSVSVDDYEAGYRGVELLAKGRRDLLVLSFPVGQIIGFDERARGAAAAARALGLRIRVQHGTMTETYGETVVARLLKRGKLPDAIFCLNDITAIGVLKACREHAIEVPGRLAVLGVDDTPSVSYCLGLSSIRHPIGDLARAVCRTLLESLDRPATPPPNVVLPTIMMARTTT